MKTEKRKATVQRKRTKCERKKMRRKQSGRDVYIQRFLVKFGGLHWLAYEYMGPGTKLKK